MQQVTLNMWRNAAGFVGAIVAGRLIAPVLIHHNGWTHVGTVLVTAMLVFVAYTAYYLGVGTAYIVRRRAHDRHIFPEGIRLEGDLAVKLGLRYLVLASIAAFGATLLYAVVLRGLRYTQLMGP
ncbi:MAG: hypothetical protein OEW11_06010 [Nitrospirota bacterium]|nr:hypothetical protein [Nitrospirota bacterium]